jgi:hypothetical protein
MSWTGKCYTCVCDENCTQNFGSTTCSEPRRRREDNIKIVLKEAMSNSVDWVCFHWNRNQLRAFVNTAMNTGAP